MLFRSAPLKRSLADCGDTGTCEAPTMSANGEIMLDDDPLFLEKIQQVLVKGGNFDEK